MSKKLLSEAQVRRFQSLASIRPLNEMYNEELYEAEEEMGAEEEAPEMEMGAEEPVAELPPPEEEAAPEMGAAEGDEVDMTEDDLAAVSDALGTLQDKLAPLLDAVDAPADELGGEEDAPEMEMGDEEEAPEMEMGAEEDEEEALLEAALKGINYQPSQKEIVKVVAKRVARRLMEAKNAQAKLDKALGKK